MNQPISTVEFDRIVPEELLPVARQRAGEERHSNLPREEAAVLKARLWKVGRTLRIAFVDHHLPPDRRQPVRDQVKRYASQWLEHANLHFLWDCRCMESDIRIAFDPGLGNWSYVGTDALAFDDCQITMNLGELAQTPSAQRCQQVILHEFGHALGMIHEHQSPGSRIEWNRDVVLDLLSGPPNFWTEDQVEINVFQRYDQTQFEGLLPTGTAFDQASIMIYPIPRGWTTGEVDYLENIDLSETDKMFITRCYPR